MKAPTRPSLPPELREKIDALLSALGEMYSVNAAWSDSEATLTEVDAANAEVAAARAALDAALLAIVRECEVLSAENARYHNAIRWALGYEDFAERQPGQGAYWWRKELAERAGPLADFSAARATTPEETPAHER